MSFPKLIFYRNIEPFFLKHGILETKLYDKLNSSHSQNNFALNNENGHAVDFLELSNENATTFLMGRGRY
jgi:hypothetical protein